MNRLKLKEVENYWATKEVKKNGISIRVTLEEAKEDRSKYAVTFSDDNDYEVNFQIIEFEADEELLETEKSYLVKCEGDYITDCLDFTSSLDECINGCVYYFHTRY